jgi:capsular exopolysaccharide synthesis family protein
VELREYVRACRRRWVWIVVPVLLAAGLAAGLTLAREPAYKSSMVLFVTTGAGDPDSGAARLNSYISLLTGPRVAQTVVTKVGPPLTADEVRQSLKAEVQAGTDLLVVSAVDASADRSRSIVRAATTELVALVKKLNPPAAGSDGPPPSVSVAQDAVTTREPDGLARNVGFSAVLGLLVGAVAVAVREATRKTVAEEDDLRRLGLGTVGTIAIGGRLGRSGHPDEALAEAFRRLRSLLPEVAGLRRDGARGASLVLTGANPKEGTTAVACGLAIAMAETGARVLLVDANLRSPGVGRYLSMESGPGLTDVLAGRMAVTDVLQDPLDGRLTVLPPGDHLRDPGEVLASPSLGTTMRGLTERFDVVLVDAPPLHGVADAAVLSKVTDGALLVVRANRTRTVDVQRSTDLLERVGARLVGAVLNALPRRLPTGPAGRRAPSVPAAADNLGLVTSLINGTDEPADDGAETGVMPPFPPPARGRARVVEAEDPDDYASRARVVESTADVPYERAGRARVVEGTAEVPREPAGRAPVVEGTAEAPRDDAGRVVRGQARVAGAEPPVRPTPPAPPQRPAIRASAEADDQDEAADQGKADEEHE